MKKLLYSTFLLLFFLMQGKEAPQLTTLKLPTHEYIALKNEHAYLKDSIINLKAGPNESYTRYVDIQKRTETFCNQANKYHNKILDSWCIELINEMKK